MRRKLVLLAAPLIAIGIGAAARATVVINQLDTTSFTGGVSPDGLNSWVVTPNAADTTGGNPGSYSQTENSYGPASGFTEPTPNGSLGESFKATQSGTLTDLQILVTGAISGVTFNLDLYDAGPAGSNGAGLADESTRGYGNNSIPYENQNSGTGLVTVGANLLNADSQGLTMPSYNTLGTVAAAIDFNLQDVDSGIPILAGEEYVLEIGNPSSTNLVLLRNGATGADYTSGQAFRSRAPLNGNTARDLAVSAVVAVPEPATIGLAAVACIGLMARRRHNA